MTEEVLERRVLHFNQNRPYSPHSALEVGACFKVGHAYNPFFSFFESPPAIEVYPGIPAKTGVNLLEKVVGKQVPSPPKLGNIALEFLRNSVNLSRELLTELVRERDFPAAPSRMKCLWVFDDETQADHWRMRLHPGNSGRLVELAVTGRLHRCDAGWLLSDTGDPISKSLNEAARYWGGDPCPTDPQPELLFVGEAEVVALI